MSFGFHCFGLCGNKAKSASCLCPQKHDALVHLHECIPNYPHCNWQLVSSEARRSQALTCCNVSSPAQARCPIATMTMRCLAACFSPACCLSDVFRTVALFVVENHTASYLGCLRCVVHVQMYVYHVTLFSGM